MIEPVPCCICKGNFIRVHNIGSESKEFWAVYCGTYACNNPVHCIGTTKESAIKIWNKDNKEE